MASPLSSTTSGVSKKQWLEIVPESGDVLHQPKKNLRTMNSERRKKRHVLSRKINLLYIRVFITTRRVVEHFSMYVYEHTTKIASPATILHQDGFLKNIPTGKMKFVREEVSRVTIIEGS